jgi:hypothetical protein
MNIISNRGTHSKRSDHYRALAGEAMNSAADTPSPVMRDSLLRLAACWIDLAAETEFVKHIR